MQAIIINITNKFGYIGIMLLIAIENIFPPIPSEVILTFGGFVTTQQNSKMNILGVLVFSTLGSIIGAIVLYCVGKILNKERLKKIIKGKIGKVLCLKSKDIDSADKWFDKRGNKTVLFCRFIPVVRSLISIPAGMSEMSLPKFFIYTTIGSLIWNFVLISLGSIFGENYKQVVDVFDKYSFLTVIILFIIFILIIIYFINRNKKNRQNNK